MAEHDSEPAAALDRRSLIWYVARLIGAAAVVIVVIVSVPGLGGLRARLSHAGGGWTLVSSALEVGSVMCFVVAFHSALAGRVRWRNAAPLALVAQGFVLFDLAALVAAFHAVGPADCPWAR